jgi:hypothetical protein
LGRYVTVVKAPLDTSREVYLEANTYENEIYVHNSPSDCRKNSTRNVANKVLENVAKLKYLRTTVFNLICI